MNRVENYAVLKDRIVTWLSDYLNNNGLKSFVVGVSGGIDSSVVSTLCAETGLPTYAIGMPIHQNEEQENLSDISMIPKIQIVLVITSGALYMRRLLMELQYSGLVLLVD